MQDWKNKFIGGIEFTFLFGRGIKAFEGTRREAAASLAPAALTFLASLLFSLRYPPKGMELGYGTAQVLLTDVLHFLMTFFLTNALVGGVSAIFRKEGRFWLFFAAGNWASFAFFAVCLPFMALALSGIVGREEMDRIFALLTCYWYVITACIAWRAYRVNWELAAAISIFTLFIAQESGHFLYAVQGIPIPW